MNRQVSCIFSFLFLITLKAQMPETDIWLFDLKKDKSKNLIAAEGVNLTSRQGYDNQPGFSPDGRKIFYSSMREDQQTDIYYLRSGSKKPQRITYSPESEYSPQQISTGQIGVVRVEKDSSQRIHFIDPENGQSVRSLGIDSVGYYSFVNSDTLVYYKLTSPHSLRYHVLSTGEDRLIVQDPGRGFVPADRHSIYLTVKDTAAIKLYKYDFLLRKLELVSKYRSDSEDISWHPLTGIMRSEKNTIMQFVSADKEWRTLFDLSKSGIQRITRFTIDAKARILLVVEQQ